MLKVSYVEGFLYALEKIGSTAFSRHLAASLGGTPKSVTRPLYEEAMKRSGKTGRQAFRTTRASHLGGKARLSWSDPLNRFPHKAVVKGDHGGYISKVLRHKRNSRPLRPDVAKGTIATRPEVRNHPIRKTQIQIRGVGDLKKGTSKERVELRREKGRIANMTPSQVEKQRMRGRNEGMSPEQIERNRTRSREHALSRKEENPEMYLEGQRHSDLVRKLRRQGYVLTPVSKKNDIR